MTEKEILAILEDAMELDEGELSAETVLEDLDEWDSLSKLSLMAVVKKKLDKTLTAAEIRAFETVNDIISYMK